MLGKDIMGRIYISTQGINAQYSGLREDAVAYAQWVAQQQHFQGLHWTAEDIQGHQFPKLRLKVRPNLVQLAGGTQQLPICDPEVLVHATHHPETASLYHAISACPGSRLCPASLYRHGLNTGIRLESIHCSEGFQAWDIAPGCYSCVLQAVCCRHTHRL